MRGGHGGEPWRWWAGVGVLVLLPVFAVFVVMTMPARFGRLRNAGILCVVFGFGGLLMWPTSTGRVSTAYKLAGAAAALSMMTGVVLVLASVVMGAWVTWREGRVARRRGFEVLAPTERVGR